MKLQSPRESYLWLKALWDHRRSQHMTRAQLEALQSRKFRLLAAHAFRKSPYYRELMEARGIDPLDCRAADFPVLTKADVIRHFDRLVTDPSITRARVSEFLARSTDPRELMDGRYHVLHTSGTSGTVGYYVYSHEAWIRGASHTMRVSPLRWRLRTAFVAATRGHFAGASLMLTGNHGTNAALFDVRTFDIGQPMPQLIDALNAFQPQVLTGYAAVLKVLAEAQLRGELRIRPIQIGNGGEPLPPGTKSLLERVFNVPVLNAYASSEHLYMGMTFPGVDGMHLMEDELLFEFGPDHTCVTNLFNHTMPLIRYRMDDVLVPAADGHSPFPYLRVEGVVGRTEDALVFTNRHGQRDFIHPIVLVEIVVPGLDAWQIIVEDAVSFRFRARLDPGLSAAGRDECLRLLQARLEAILSEKEMINVRFHIEEVEALTIDPRTGKFRLVLHEKPEMAQLAMNGLNADRIGLRINHTGDDPRAGLGEHGIPRPTGGVRDAG
jgi:phenylacetate-coenzyme A ligase PaaK-like adenylate-forming protein